MLRLGATHAVDPADLKEAMGAIAPEGPTTASTRSAIPETSATALRFTRSGGTTVMVGLPPTGLRLDLDPADFLRREKFLTGTMYGSEDPAVALPILLEHVAAGRLELARCSGPSSRSMRSTPRFGQASSCRPGASSSSPEREVAARRAFAPYGSPAASASTACSCSQLRYPYSASAGALGSSGSSSAA